MAFSLPNRLPTITIGYCFINHHKPTTLCCHGNNFGYVVAYSFAYTMVSADFLRNVPIIRYLHLSTTTHTFVVFYSLGWMHCIPCMEFTVALYILQGVIVNLMSCKSAHSKKHCIVIDVRVYCAAGSVIFR